MKGWAQKGKGFRGISVKAQQKMIRRLEEQKAELLAKKAALDAQVVEMVGEGRAELLKIKLLHKSIR